MSPRASRPVLDSARFGRTPVLFLLGLAACCLIAIVALVLVVAQRGPAPTLVGLLLALLPIPLLVALILYLDRLEPEPRALLAAIFGAGAGIAVITALLGRALHTGVITTPDLDPHASVGGHGVGGGGDRRRARRGDAERAGPARPARLAAHRDRRHRGRRGLRVHGRPRLRAGRQRVRLRRGVELRRGRDRRGVRAARHLRPGLPGAVHLADRARRRLRGGPSRGTRPEPGDPRRLGRRGRARRAVEPLCVGRAKWRSRPLTSSSSSCWRPSSSR